MKNYRRFITAIIPILGLLAFVPVMGAHAQTDDTMYDPPTGTITIGGLFSLTGEASSFGTQAQTATELGIEDFNAYLAEQGVDWRLALSSADSATNPVLALENVQTFHSKEIDNILGVLASALVSHVREYANNNNMLIISPGSTAPSLAIPDDSVYRLIPDDSNQGKAAGSLLSELEYTAMVPVWRGDTYGDGLKEKTAEDFIARGGDVHAGVRYNPDTPDLSLEMELLAKYVAEMADSCKVDVEDGQDCPEGMTHGTERTAIFLIAFDEVVQLMQIADRHSILHEVAWVAAEAVAQSGPLIKDPLAAGFSEDVELLALQVLTSPGQTYDDVHEKLVSRIGTEPTQFVYPAYDSVWVLGKSILKANSAHPDAIKSVIDEVAAEYSGALASTELNEAGDLANANYMIYKVEGGEWVKTSARYSVERDLLTAFEQPTGDVPLGAIYPLTGGGLSERGPHRLASSQLGVEEFNSFVKSLALDWQINLVHEDSKNLPQIADEAIKSLKAKKAHVVIGIPASGNVKHVKQYADLSDVLVFSCCSTSPALTIADDNVFRLAPDDATQGRALAKLMEASGIEAMVTIWIENDYGNELARHTHDNFEKIGTVEEGIPYDAEQLKRSPGAEIDILAEKVQKLVDEYGADKVAVLMISYDESLLIVQAASEYPILDDVRWFGAETFVGVEYFAKDPIANTFINSVEFTAMFVSDDENENDVRDRIVERIRSQFGSDPASYVNQAYDLPWLVGLSILKSGIYEADTIKEVLPSVAKTYSGALVSTELNEFGDMVPLDLAIWQVIDSEWVEQGKYSLTTNTIEPLQ